MEQASFQRPIDTDDEPFGPIGLAATRPGVILRFDRQRRFRYVSPSVEEATGFAPEQFLGRTHRELGYPDGLARMWEDGIDLVFATGAETQLRCDFPLGDVPRYFFVHLAPERDADGTVVAVLGTARDISEELRAERELRERDRLLAEAQRLARLGFWEWWPKTGEVTWTDELYRLLGYEPGAIRPTLEAFQARMRPEDRLAAQQGLEQRLAAQKGFTYEHHIVAPDGTLRLLSGHGQAELDAAGNVVRLYGTTQDVTERRAIEDEMARRAVALEQAREIDRLKSQFVSSVSHELRTPLSSIQGYAELLVDGVAGVLSEAQLKFVEQIERGAKRLASLVDDLLDFARLESGAFRLRYADDDLAAKFREVIESFEPQAREGDVTLRADLPPGTLRVYCDAYRVSQVLLNLVSNALKFTPRGGLVDVRAAVRGGELRVEVSDTGVGIAEGDQAKLFRRFAQLDASNTRAAGGTGLGLSISKAIVEAHGGAIGLESRPGAGSTFWFALPLAGPSEGR